MREMVAKAARQAGYARSKLRDPKARQNYRDAIHVYERLTAQFPDHIWYNAGFIESLREQASLLSAPECKKEADASTRRALEVAEGLIANKDAERHCFSLQLAGPFNNLAWDLVRRAASTQAEAALAVRIAHKAVEWEPKQPAFWHTLGVARYRAGDYRSAALALQKSMDLKNGGDAADWFFLAAAFHKIGDRSLARRWYDQAIAQLKHGPQNDQARLAELHQFRQEAAVALGLSDTPPKRTGANRSAVSSLVRLPADLETRELAAGVYALRNNSVEK